MRPTQPVPAATGLLPTLESAALFAQGREVRIRHAGEEYRLRLTSNNKLILTK
ncbi:MAG: hemin uptake protein HemP [Moraxellaceae bacterium]